MTGFADYWPGSFVAAGELPEGVASTFTVSRTTLYRALIE